MIKRYNIITATIDSETFGKLVERQHGGLVTYTDHLAAIEAAVKADRASRQGPLDAAIETLERLRNEVDGGWTPDAVDNFRRLGPLLKMASA